MKFPTQIKSVNEAAEIVHLFLLYSIQQRTVALTHGFLSI
jgi:hypothetical protein